MRRRNLVIVAVACMVVVAVANAAQNPGHESKRPGGPVVPAEGLLLGGYSNPEPSDWWTKREVLDRERHLRRLRPPQADHDRRVRVGRDGRRQGRVVPRRRGGHPASLPVDRRAGRVGRQRSTGKLQDRQLPGRAGRIPRAREQPLLPRPTVGWPGSAWRWW